MAMLAGATGLSLPAPAQPAATVSEAPADPHLLEDLIAANRMLANQGVLNGCSAAAPGHRRPRVTYLESEDGERLTRYNS